VYEKERNSFENELHKLFLEDVNTFLIFLS
jgi:hypothetical protein